MMYKFQISVIMDC